MTRLERRFLSRRVCGLCERSLDRIDTPRDCGAIGDRCSDDVISERRQRCLETYKPRTRINPPPSPAGLLPGKPGNDRLSNGPRVRRGNHHPGRKRESAQDDRRHGETAPPI
jgi:hypothetical protein